MSLQLILGAGSRLERRILPEILAFLRPVGIQVASRAASDVKPATCVALRNWWGIPPKYIFYSR